MVVVVIIFFSSVSRTGETVENGNVSTDTGIFIGIRMGITVEKTGKKSAFLSPSGIFHDMKIPSLPYFLIFFKKNQALEGEKGYKLPITNHGKTATQTFKEEYPVNCFPGMPYI